MNSGTLLNNLFDYFIMALCVIMSIFSIWSAMRSGNDHHMTQATIWICTAIVLDKLGK